MENDKGFWFFIKKLASRKLLVFIVATVLLMINKIAQDIWLYVGVAYMGLNTAIAAIDGLREVKTKLQSTSSTTVTFDGTKTTTSNASTSALAQVQPELQLSKEEGES